MVDIPYNQTKPNQIKGWHGVKSNQPTNQPNLKYQYLKPFGCQQMSNVELNY